jgi:glycosyltransferase involved in cell wall biosynthesis
VATTPRLERDLINVYAADAAKLRLIPNGIAPEAFDPAAAVQRGQETLLRLGFLGRLEHNQKGVFHLPKIVQELNRLGVAFRLRIAGKGRHRSVIENEMRAEVERGQVEFIGAITPKQVPSFLAETDVFIFTSHFEGCPNALLEALMAGCVPVSWLIEGITDFIIEDGITGFISPMGDCQAFAQKIAILANDRRRLQLMSAAAAKAGRERFSDQRSAAAYAKLIEEVMSGPPPPWVPKPWSEFQNDPNFPHTWRELLPLGFRNRLRQLFLNFSATQEKSL